MLKPLLLPQIVEQRRQRESMGDTDMDSPALYHTYNSSTSDIPSPVTPTFSTRHTRYSSSASPLEQSPNTPTSPTSPTFFANLKVGKRPLPDVQEEPHEKEEDFDMVDEHGELYDCFCDSHPCTHQSATTSHSLVQLSSKPDFDYDLSDGFFSDGEQGSSPRSKRRRSIESPFATLATRIGTRFPAFSRKWQARRGKAATLFSTDAQGERSASRAASSRSSSLSNSIRPGSDKPLPLETQAPPTPTRSVPEADGENRISACTIDVERANRSSSEREEGLATTPLLPPLMLDTAASKQVPVQSPLQSPSVADTPNLSAINTPIDVMSSSTLGIPSPPLSNKPSVSSFHRAQLSRPGHLVQTADIPAIAMNEELDEWAIKLGHANFTIHPEPYVPESFDIEACRQLRANWDQARCNYTKHLVRTGEHYGVTSNTYRYTEEKWAQVDAEWKRNNDLTIQNTVDSDGDAFSTLKYSSFGNPGAPNIMTKIPSLNDPTSGGKFPQLGDEDIVGPMVKGTAQLQRSPSKKAKLMRFLAEKFPTGLGRVA